MGSFSLAVVFGMIHAHAEQPAAFPPAGLAHTAKNQVQHARLGFGTDERNSEVSPVFLWSRC